MSRARTYTKAQIFEAAAAAAAHGVRVILRPTGEMEFLPKKFGKMEENDDSAEAALNRWLNGREAGRRAKDHLAVDRKGIDND